MNKILNYYIKIKKRVIKIINIPFSLNNNLGKILLASYSTFIIILILTPNIF